MAPRSSGEGSLVGLLLFHEQRPLSCAESWRGACSGPRLTAWQCCSPCGVSTITSSVILAPQEHLEYFAALCPLLQIRGGSWAL